ncbi:hypothetical protein IE53DRAFT_398093 [Violaceomyces palustris]|uniref:Uncharacterized protein n=1 Tax=Violaceomyces palustris TaxID=1673888 RepID=A0ACD0NU19_9BASI|nr:hypothetical protein IE53DRAFT_398093 [Violaceomyces palustris]
MQAHHDHPPFSESTVVRQEASHSSPSSPSSPSSLPPFFPAQTSKPADFPRAYLDGTQDYLKLFNLTSIYERSVRPYNPSAQDQLDPSIVQASQTTQAVKRKALKPPPTYAHYVEDLPGKVKPQRKTAKARQADKGVSLLSILHKPEYTPQSITPFDSEVMESAFKVEAGEVEEIDQSLLEPDEEDSPKKKKKKKDKSKEGLGSKSATIGGGQQLR